MGPLEWISVWTLVRISGIVSLFLLLFAIFCGAILPLLSPKWKALSMFIHQFAGWVGLSLGFIHGLLLHFNSYVPYSLKEIFVPFTAQNQPVLSGLGTIGFWLFALVIFSSDFRTLFKKRIWKSIHLLSMPLFIIVAIHGIFQGTDRYEIWFIVFCTVLFSIFLVLVFFRFFIYKPEPKVKKVSA